MPSAMWPKDSATRSFDSAKISVSSALLLNETHRKARPPARAVTRAIMAPIGFALIAAFQSHCAAVTRPISPVRTPTAICFKVMAPVEAAVANASALVAAPAAAIAVFIASNHFVADCTILNALIPTTASAISGKMIFIFLPRKSTAFARGGSIVFARLVTTFPRSFKILDTVLMAFRSPPLSKERFKIFTVSFTGFWISLGKSFIRPSAKAPTICFAAWISWGALSPIPFINDWINPTARSTTPGAACASLVQASARIEPKAVTTPSTPLLVKALCSSSSQPLTVGRTESFKVLVTPWVSSPIKDIALSFSVDICPLKVWLCASIAW